MLVEKFNYRPREGTQACIVCGRLYAKREELVCSVECRDKAEYDERLLNQ